MKEKIRFGGKDFIEGMREEYDLRPSGGNYKSRGCYWAGGCINKIPCKHYKTEVCDKCFKKDMYEPEKDPG